MILGDLSNLKKYHTANAEDQCIRLVVPTKSNSTLIVSLVWAP